MNGRQPQDELVLSVGLLVDGGAKREAVSWWSELFVRFLSNRRSSTPDFATARMGVVKSGVTQRSGVVSAGAARAALVPTLPCQPDEALEAAVCEQDS